MVLPVMDENKDVAKIIRYQCPICKKEYETTERAVKCKNRGFSPKFKIGDIVFSGAGYTWYNGDRRWISNPNVKFGRGRSQHKGCFKECCTYKFYWVIIDVDGYPDNLHKPRYHLATGAMKGKKGYQDKYIDMRSKSPEMVIEPPEYVVKDSKRFMEGVHENDNS